MYLYGCACLYTSARNSEDFICPDEEFKITKVDTIIEVSFLDKMQVKRFREIGNTDKIDRITDKETRT